MSEFRAWRLEAWIENWRLTKKEYCLSAGFITTNASTKNCKAAFVVHIHAGVGID
ncbi:hypothetical protein TUM3792_08920 [Shewanella sp. MBTL60-007]|nr:hypothetical protein TUM3792_08920 [Shewanella sp. MBTL60-007]